MSDRPQLGWRVNPAIKEEFTQYVRDVYEDREGVLGRSLERAMLDFLPEERRKEVLDALPTHPPHPPSQREPEKRKNEVYGDTVLNRTREIADQVEAQAGEAPVVAESVLIQAIQDVAGASQPTIRQYKRVLKDRRLLFEHPRHDTWFTDPEEFVQMVESNFPDRNNDIYMDYNGDDWVEEHLDPVDDTDPSFQ